MPDPASQDAPSRQVPFIHDHGLYLLHCPPGQELEFFSSEGFARRFGREGDPDSSRGDEEAERMPPIGRRPPAAGGARAEERSDKPPAWHFVADRTQVFAPGKLHRLCVTVEGGLGKTRALKQAQVLWQSDPRRRGCAVFLEAADLPRDFRHFLEKPRPEREHPLLVDLLDKTLARGPLKDASRRGACAAQVVKAAIRQGRFLLLVDAFDQMSGRDSHDNRDRVVALTEFLRIHPQVHCVISGRPVAVQQLGQLDVQPSETALLGPGWTFCQVPDFTEPQVTRFLDHGAPPGESRSAQLARIETDLVRVPRFLERLRTIPFARLQALRTASDVYWESLNYLIRAGLTRHGVVVASTWTLEKKVKYWALLAIEMARQGYRQAVPEGERDEFVRRVFDSRGQWLKSEGIANRDQLAETLTQLLQLDINLETCVQDGREDGAYRWQNQTLHDFFTAVWLTRFAGERQGEGEQGLTDVTWFTSHPRLTIRVRAEHVATRAEQRELERWQPVWRFVVEMPCVAGVFKAQDIRPVCEAKLYLALLAPLLAERAAEELRPRPTELIYRSWPTLLALAGRLSTTQGVPWSAEDVQKATTKLQAEVWSAVTASNKDSETPISGDVPARANALLRQFLGAYPRLAQGTGPNQACAVARDFETWFQPIPRADEATLRFPMSSEGDYGSNARATHDSDINAPFSLAKYAVTNAVYELFDPGHWRRFSDYIRWSPKISGRSTHPHPQGPAIYVTWYDAWVACLWLHCRLPSEHEWEYACRAAPALPPQDFWFGTEQQADRSKLWCRMTRSEDRTDVVGGTGDSARQPNPWGLYDMHGNVWEWTASWFFDDPEAGRDPNAVGTSRVLRGGSFHDGPVLCRSAFRDHWRPAGIGNDFGGFRAARAKLTR
jgi:formylglycine-generating enzyme required for sulfatase activity